MLPTTNMKRYILIFFYVLIPVVFLNSCNNSPAAQDQNAAEMAKEGKVPVNANVFKTDKGWGYSIMIDNKLFIRQDIIPVVEGNQGFATKEDATKVAELVLTKMKNKEKPIVKKEDLEQLGIIK